MKLSFLVEDKKSWVYPHIEKLAKEVRGKLYTSIKQIEGGDILFIIACISLVPSYILDGYKYKLVVHESDLPKGRGFSPVQYQILEGKNEIPIYLIDAANNVDTGDIFYKDKIILDGTELLPEIRLKQWKKTEDLIKRFLSEAEPKSTPQVGKPTYYKRRTHQEDELDINKTIREQFNHLRILHNEEYRGWFKHKNKKYYITIHNGEADEEGT